MYFNQITIEVINSRNVPDLFKDHFVKWILFSHLIALVCIVLRELYVYKPKFCNQELRIPSVAMISFFKMVHPSL